MDAELGVLLLGLGHAADDEHGHIGIKIADGTNEVGAVHAGHDVVCDDEVNGRGKLVVAELFQRALGIQNGDDEEAGPLQDRLPCCGLHRIVVDQKNRCLHAVGLVLVLKG